MSSCREEIKDAHCKENLLIEDYLGNAEKYRGSKN
jgi:hypothetical protein